MQRIAAMVSAVCEANLFVYAFDTIAYPVQCQGTDMAAWEKAFRGINAGGATSIGVPVVAMRKAKQYAEQLVAITDEGENTPPLFANELEQYRRELNADPALCIVRTPGGSSHLERTCRDRGWVIDVFQFTGDYYSLPNLIPMLSRPSKLELLMEILSWPLPERRGA